MEYPFVARMRGFVGAVMCLLMAATYVSAQEAANILDAATAKYNEATNYEASEDCRVIYASLGEGVKGDLPNYSLPRGLFYINHRFKARRPEGIWLARRAWSSIGINMSDVGDAGEWSYLVMNGPSSGVRSYLQQGSWLSGTMSDQTVWNALQQNFSVVEERVVFRYFINARNARKPPELGVAEASIVGAETFKGRPAYKIEGKTVRLRKPIWVWVDKESGLVIRTIVVTFMGNPKGSEVIINETVYGNQRIGVSFGSDDFSVASTVTDKSPLDPKKMGFGPVDDLMREAKIAELAKVARATAQSKTPSPAAERETEKPEEAEPVGAQILTQEQMEGIVLIEGEGGNTASGFMTKIRDVDFVVTNLHVLAQGGKFKVKNLRGEEIPVSGIFGALGSDIAIMRIAKAGGTLTLAPDVFKSVKIGDRIVVVGNRLGGGVATQTIGQVKGVGPTRVEVNANFQPGNSGSPIVAVSNGDVVGVATYTSAQRADVEPSPNGTRSKSNIEKRWFGYRLDSVQKWEAIDLTRWSAQATRIDEFARTSYAIAGILWGQFGEAKEDPALRDIVERFETKLSRTTFTSTVATTETKDMLRAVRALAEGGVKKFSEGDYYDYFRTCLYWDHSVSLQIEYRNMLIAALKRNEDSVVGYLSKLRGGR